MKVYSIGRDLACDIIRKPFSVCCLESHHAVDTIYQMPTFWEKVKTMFCRQPLY